MARKYCVNFTLRCYKNARLKREANSSGQKDRPLILTSGRFKLFSFSAFQFPYIAICDIATGFVYELA